MLELGSSAAATYKLKSTTGKFNVHLDKYSAEQRQFIRDTMGDKLYYFGYANVDENPTGFFEFDGHTEENLALHNKFRADNARALDEVCSKDRTLKTYVHSQEEVFPIFDKEDLTKLMECSFDFARGTIKKAQ